jgi:iron complex outermembrane recepter protein
VIIMIDGKPSPMSGADLGTYLKGLPASAIERIEIITNPSSKYDAAGNSGIIDIRMKKDQRLGTNGTLSGGAGHGKYPKANAGLQLNHRNKNVNLFGSYNYNYRENFNHLVINRNFYNNGVLSGSDNKDNYAFFPMSSHAARAGADFFPSKNTIIGFVVSGNGTFYTRDAKIATNVLNKDGQPVFNFMSSADDEADYKNLVSNVNFKHTMKGNKELTADVDYGKYLSTSLTRTASYFYELDGSKKTDDKLLLGDQQGDLSFKTGKVDYVNPLKKNGKFEMGFKTSHVSSDNDAKFFDGIKNIVDTTKTNRFFYDEYNNAGYLNYFRDFKKISVQFGLRGENTFLKTHQVKKDKRFDSSYFQLFPSAFINFKLKNDQSIGLSLSRRIDRPGYSQLNPFLLQVDASIYATGNPWLKPQMTWSSEASFTRKNMNFTLGYSHTVDPQTMTLSRILDVMPDFEIEPGQDSNITVQIPVNLRSSDYFGFSASTPLRINSWWNMVNNLNVFYQHFNGDLGGVKLNEGGPQLNFRTNNSFTFKKGWGAETNLNFTSGGRNGYSISEPSWGLNAGVQKQLFKNKGTLRFNVSDIFWTNLPRAQVNYPGRYLENWHAYRETRVANLNFIYRFGNNKVQAARNRKTASEEETRRAG